MPKKTISQLYDEFERARAAIETFRYTTPDDAPVRSPEHQAWQKKFDALVAVASRACSRVVKTPANPANPIAEMLLKIRAAGWGAGCPDALWADGAWESCVDLDIAACLISIRADLQAIQAQFGDWSPWKSIAAITPKIDRHGYARRKNGRFAARAH